MKSKKKTKNCPYCNGKMRTVAMECPSCEIEIRGDFRDAQFQQLSSDDLQLLEQYLLSGFSIKALEERTGMGYTALRSRIDRLISNYKSLADHDDEKRRILERVGKGEISAQQAAQLISGLGKKL